VEYEKLLSCSGSARARVGRALGFITGCLGGREEIIRGDASHTSGGIMKRQSNPEQYELLTQMSDEDLMAQFQAGTVDAFDILVSRHKDPLTNFIYRYLGDMETCEDLLQETFLRVYRNRYSYQRIAKYTTWVYTIARNLALSEYRKRKSRQMYSLQSLTRDEEEYQVEIPDDTNTPDRFTESQIQDQHIQQALGRIPEEFREVVVLRDVQQLSYEEIAQITGLPMGTVKSRIHRGRSALMSLLSDVYEA